MKKLLFALFLCPFISMAQDPIPRFENDTLYTLSGYKIFRGQTLEFAKGLERYDRFKFVSVKNGILSTSLTDCSVIVKEFRKFWISGLNNGYIIFDGYLKRKDGTTDYIVLQMAFDRAIENSPVLPSEIKVPDEFRNKYKRNIKREKLFLTNIYQDKLINKEAYQEMKKKLDKE
ncbi:MAG: hypothetical protein ABIR78_13530 [Ferruginibacter sp.]